MAWTGTTLFFTLLFYPEDGGSRFLWNVCTFLPDCIKRCTRKQYFYWHRCECTSNVSCLSRHVDLSVTVFVAGTFKKWRRYVVACVGVYVTYTRSRRHILESGMWESGMLDCVGCSRDAMKPLPFCSSPEYCFFLLLFLKLSLVSPKTVGIYPPSYCPFIHLLSNLFTVCIKRIFVVIGCSNSQISEFVGRLQVTVLSTEDK